MHKTSIKLVWIVVKEFKQAIKYYTEIVGLEVKEMNEEWGWAELEGQEGGTRLGIAQQRLQGQDLIGPGQNAVMTFTVDNLEQAIRNIQQQGAILVGDMEVIPEQVKLQSLRDPEGNLIQIVENISP